MLVVLLKLLFLIAARPCIVLWAEKMLPRGSIGPMTEFCKCINVFHFSIVNSKSNGGDFPGASVVKTANAGSTGSIPGQGAKTPHASRPKNQNTKQKQYCNRFNTDFRNGPHQKRNQMENYTERWCSHGDSCWLDQRSVDQCSWVLVKAPILLWVNFLHPELAANREELPGSTKEALGVVCQDTREQDNYLSKAAQRATVHRVLGLALPLHAAFLSTFQPAPLEVKACHVVMSHCLFGV